MTVSAQASGTQTATITTEHQLADTGVQGTFAFIVDPNAMVAGDVLELRVYQMVLTGGTPRVLYFARYAGAQPADDMVKQLGPVSNELTDSTAVRFSLKQTFGTGRAFPWKVLKFT
jgi:hypothetical protein